MRRVLSVIRASVVLATAMAVMPPRTIAQEAPRPKLVLPQAIDQCFDLLRAYGILATFDLNANEPIASWTYWEQARDRLVSLTPIMFGLIKAYGRDSGALKSASEAWKSHENTYFVGNSAQGTNCTPNVLIHCPNAKPEHERKAHLVQTVAPQVDKLAAFCVRLGQ